MDADTVYNDNPAEQAMQWARAGFGWVHVVDLNGAVDGQPVNNDAVEAIIDAVDIPVQLGGGIRTLDQIRHWIDHGVSRVILGTAALRDPDLVNQACSLFPGQIVVGIDARGGHVAVEGWVETSDMHAVDLAKIFEDAGVEAIIYTDIDRDGTGEGVNLAATKELAKAVNIPVIASGGIGSVNDVLAVRNLEPHGVSGLIIGKALYDQRVDPFQILDIVQAAPMALDAGVANDA